MGECGEREDQGDGEGLREVGEERRGEEMEVILYRISSTRATVVLMERSNDSSLWAKKSCGPERDSL